MHSSRMRTTRSLPNGGGGLCPGWSLSGRPPPPVNRITDRCKNITFPQLRLRAVINCRTLYYTLLQIWHQNVLSFLPPANEVWGKAMILHLCVILFTGARGSAPPRRQTPPLWMQTPHASLVLDYVTQTNKKPLINRNIANFKTKQWEHL